LLIVTFVCCVTRRCSPPFTVVCWLTFTVTFDCSRCVTVWLLRLRGCRRLRLVDCAFTLHHVYLTLPVLPFNTFTLYVVCAYVLLYVCDVTGCCSLLLLTRCFYPLFCRVTHNVTVCVVVTLRVGLRLVYALRLLPFTVTLFPVDTFGYDVTLPVTICWLHFVRCIYVYDGCGCTAR